MAISKERKSEVVAQYSKWISNSKALILAEYTGLTMKQMDDLRAKRQHSDRICIARRPADGESHDGLRPQRGCTEDQRRLPRQSSDQRGRGSSPGRDAAATGDARQIDGHAPGSSQPAGATAGRTCPPGCSRNPGARRKRSIAQPTCHVIMTADGLDRS